MALKGYFIQATFEDGTEISAYAAYDGTWYYFYTDRRFRFTLTSAGAVDIQQYQPIGSNMAWYDIDIITAVSVEQFDPDNSGGGGTIPDDVYTKEEVQQLIAEAVAEVEAQIPDLVEQAVQEALDGLDDRYVLKAGDTMTGPLLIRHADGDRYIQLAADNLVLSTYNGSYSILSRGSLNLSSANGAVNLATTAATTTLNLRYGPASSKTYAVQLYASGSNAWCQVHGDSSSNYGRLEASSAETRLIVRDDNGNNTWYKPAQISAWTNGGTSNSLITPGTDAISFNKTVQVPTNGSFLVSGMCRYGGTLINRYGGELQLQFNDQSRITFNDYGSYTGITILNEGRLYCRRGTGISSSEDSTFGYNGLWLCGPIYHYGNSANENAKYYAYSGTGASFQLMGTLDASTPTLGGLQLSGHNGLRITSGSNNQLSIYGAGGNELVMSDGNIYLRAGTTGSTSVVGRIFIRDYFTRQYATALLSNQIALSAYISSMLSTSGSPSTTNINIISLGLIDALNDVINHIQDSIGTNYSASYSSGFLAGGGQARGGGVGRGY